MLRDYAQPSFYHFSQDSIELVRFILEDFKNDMPGNFLELFSGCGVITLELSKKLKGNWCLVEKQEEFRSFLNRNLSWKNQKVEKVYWKDCEDFLKENYERFDLIVMNPPYFFKEESRPKNDPKTDICFRISKSKFMNILSMALDSLTETGSLYLSYPKHLRSVFKDIPSIKACHEVELNRKTSCYYWI